MKISFDPQVHERRIDHEGPGQLRDSSISDLIFIQIKKEKESGYESWGPQCNSTCIQPFHLGVVRRHACQAQKKSEHRHFRFVSFQVEKKRACSLLVKPWQIFATAPSSTPIGEIMRQSCVVDLRKARPRTLWTVHSKSSTYNMRNCSSAGTLQPTSGRASISVLTGHVGEAAVV